MHKKSVPPNNLGLDASTDEEPELEDDQNFNDVNEDDGESLTWIILPMSKEEKPLLRCCYQTCDALFDDGQAFRSHFIQQHVMMLQSVGEGVCAISGCKFTYTDILLYRRHLTFHIYHACLQLRGAISLEKANQRCSHVLKDANHVFYNGDPLQCSWDDCGGMFDDVNDFFSHVAEHGKYLTAPQRDQTDKKYACLWTDCQSTAKRTFDLIQHLRHHSGEKIVSCPTCGAFFANTTKLVDHCSRQIPNEKLRLVCMHCNKAFPSDRLLREHLNRHVSRYKCQYCEMTVPSKHAMRWHVMHRHNDEKSHVCMICGKGYKTGLDLERHFAKHNEEKPAYECPHCGKKFKWLQSLQNHERRHLQVDERPYLCHLCPMKYRIGPYLSSHLVKAHSMSLPAGHVRFTYKKCGDGYYRVLTERYERCPYEADVEVESEDASTSAAGPST